VFHISIWEGFEIYLDWLSLFKIPVATGLLHAMLFIMIFGLSVAAKVQYFDS